MIRFRFTEDERRYLTLLGEAYRLVVQHMPPAAAAQVLRNFGKLQDMSYFEGVRQGFAAAALNEVLRDVGRDMGHLKAFQAHAMVYGSSDTPLRDVEIEWLQSLANDPAEAAAHRAKDWLDNNPMRFAPATLAEWRGEEAAVASAAPAAAVLPTEDPVEPSADMSDEDFIQTLDLGDDIPEPQGLETDAQERPDLLDRIRTCLQTMASKGWKPENWQDLIMKLHMALHVDAGFLDLQLSTPMGQTVLAQAGLVVEPGVGINVMALIEKARAEQGQEPLTESELRDAEGVEFMNNLHTAYESGPTISATTTVPVEPVGGESASDEDGGTDPGPLADDADEG